jgi:hypothetical protein
MDAHEARQQLLGSGLEQGVQLREVAPDLVQAVVARRVMEGGPGHGD